MTAAETTADLSRFIGAQHGVYEAALSELRRGAKTSHWMWFVFPQLAGLGHSMMARRYALADLAEAQAYASHPLLAARYRECCATLAGWAGQKTAEAILGTVDAMKLASSLTLFEHAGLADATAPLLDAFFAGIRDPRTMQLLRDGRPTA